MKTYLVKPGFRGIFSITKENPIDIDVIDYMTTDIDWMYQIPEDGEIMVKESDGSVSALAVKKDDIVAVFYERPWIKNKIIIITDSKWTENLIAKKEHFEKESKDGNHCLKDCIGCNCANVDA